MQNKGHYKTRKEKSEKQLAWRSYFFLKVTKNKKAKSDQKKNKLK